MRVLVLGGYGLIGLAVSKTLQSQNIQVVGLARSARQGKKLLPEADWISADMSQLTKPEDWQGHLVNVDAVINAAGILQNGLKDNVAATQRDSITALIKACAQTSIKKFVQISAPGAETTSNTAFYKTKAEADQFLKQSDLNWTILRPGLVLSPNAYGGTSLLRMLAAFPIIQPLVLPNALIQTVAIDDVTHAVSAALNNQNLSRKDFVIAESSLHTLSDLILSLRAWLGFRKPIVILPFPTWVGGIISKIADCGGWLGWRSALRSTSIAVLVNNVIGDSEPWVHATGHLPQSLDQTLNQLPSTAQERLYARMKLLFPLLLFILSGFWIASGVIGIVQHDKAVSVLDGALSIKVASLFVYLGALIDVSIGLFVLFRPLTRLISLFSIVISAGYLAASAVLTPHLWADPLGPMMKVFPVIALSLIIASLAEER